MKQEALKLALEALENELSIDWTNNDEFNTSAEKMYEAIAAIKKALAQEQEPVCPECKVGVLYECVACSSNNYPSKPEQEPVKDWAASHNAICALLRQAHDALALTSYPMMHRWVGLTDDEIDQGLLRTPYTVTAEAWREGVRWAYHQLKEKNT